MGIMTKYSKTEGLGHVRTRSRTFLHRKTKTFIFNCLGCWKKTPFVIEYDSQEIHHYCQKCYNENDNPVITEMYRLFYDMVQLRIDGQFYKEPDVLLIEGAVGVGKSCKIRQWERDYCEDDTLFITENIAAWTEYPNEKVKTHYTEGLTTNLLTEEDGFFRQLYIMRQIIEEFNQKLKTGTKCMVIERGIIGSINIAKVSPGISDNQMEVLRTYVKLFCYDQYKLCLFVGDVNVPKDTANRILINEIQMMTDEMAVIDEPDLYIDRYTDFSCINGVLDPQKNIILATKK